MNKLKLFGVRVIFEQEELAHAIDRVQLFAIDIEHMTGKLVNEK